MDDVCFHTASLHHLQHLPCRQCLFGLSQSGQNTSGQLWLSLPIIQCRSNRTLYVGQAGVATMPEKLSNLIFFWAQRLVQGLLAWPELGVKLVRPCHNSLSCMSVNGTQIGHMPFCHPFLGATLGNGPCTAHIAMHGKASLMLMNPCRSHTAHRNLWQRET